MASIKNNNTERMKAKKGVKIGIVQSLYNTEITGALLKSCLTELLASGMAEENIDLAQVPGAFELPITCQRMAAFEKYDAIIALGLVLKGETPHFDFVAGECARGIMDVSLRHDVPVIFGVLTTDNIKQARDRIEGGKVGDKGVEAARTAIHMTSA